MNFRKVRRVSSQESSPASSRRTSRLNNKTWKCQADLFWDGWPINSWAPMIGLLCKKDRFPGYKTHITNPSSPCQVPVKFRAGGGPPPQGIRNPPNFFEAFFLSVLLGDHRSSYKWSWFVNKTRRSSPLLSRCCWQRHGIFEARNRGGLQAWGSSGLTLFSLFHKKKTKNFLLLSHQRGER